MSIEEGFWLGARRTYGQRKALQPDAAGVGGVDAAEHQRRLLRGPRVRGLHSFTFQLNLSRF